MPEELEIAKANRSLARALENSTALAEAVESKDDLIKDLNNRVKHVRCYLAFRSTPTIQERVTMYRTNTYKTVTPGAQLAHGQLPRHSCAARGEELPYGC